jgi:hypothetical protein
MERLTAVSLATTIVACAVLAACAAVGAPERAAVPRSEHPRPDFERADWLNLNGEWQWEVDEKGDGEQRGLISGHDLARKIIVPFPPESKLSGIGNTDFMVHTWYRRSFTVPDSMKGKRLLLHFQAADWYARVWVNGKFAGEHKGGYSPFALEITDLVADGPNEVVVHCYDKANSGLQATGKQSFGKSEGCVYTRTTGIWQTVWLEAVGNVYVDEFALTPDLDSGRALFQGSVNGAFRGMKVRLRAFADGKQVGEEIVPASWRNTLGVLKLSRVVPWQVGKPFLYDLTIETLKGDKVIDSVRSYFGLRKISIEGNRFFINDKPVFQRLVLDQGFYPDGIYTAPTDDALRHDIEMSMAAGFNGARLHQKVFEPRLLYWADKLGYIVWGEYPSWGLNVGSPEAISVALDEWRSIIRRDRNHPAVIGWCPLNETGGDEAVARLQLAFAATQTMDPTRPFIDTSGYVHLLPQTDVYDAHDYSQNPKELAGHYALFGQTGDNPWNNNSGDPRSKYRGQPFFNSEFGGMHIKTTRNVGPGWGYDGGGLEVKDYLARYKGQADAMLDNPNICGFCYTQLTDIEQEQNGVYYYDRQQKFDPALLKAINERPAAYETQPARIFHVTWTTLVPTSETEAQDWRYTEARPEADWFKPGFDDSGWKQGKGGFGTEGTPGAVIGTRWATDDIWLRRTFHVDKLEKALYGLRIHHDEDAEVYINGTEVASVPDYATAYSALPVENLGKTLVMGENVLAVHCHQTVGGQFIDVGIEAGR